MMVLAPAWHYIPGYQNTDLPDAVRPEYMPPPEVPRAPFAEPYPWVTDPPDCWSCAAWDCCIDETMLAIAGPPTGPRLPLASSQ
jgi:hypothetical protein